MLDVSLDKRFTGFHLDVPLTVPAGETLVVVGESGSGKSTLLRLLAGLIRPDTGHITLAGRPWHDAARGIDLPPWERSVGFVPQDYALFPHLSVLDNVAFGLRASGMPRPPAEERARETMQRLGISTLGRARPSELSGGQQQRAALARALVLEPALLLLDEPLSAIDLRTQSVVRTELRRLLDALPCITLYVTHTPSEALVLGDRIAVLEHGRLTQVGTRHEFLTNPRSPYVATFLGTNLLQGDVVERAPGGLALIRTDASEIWAEGAVGEGDRVHVVVDPRDISLGPVSAAAPRNVLQGPVTELFPEPPSGAFVRVTLGTRPPMVAMVPHDTVATLGLREDAVVSASFQASAARCYR